MEMLCVVEGVENRNQLDLLAALRCNLVQGYHFARPLPFEDIVESVRKHGTVAGLALSSTDGMEELRLTGA